MLKTIKIDYISFNLKLYLLDHRNLKQTLFSEVNKSTEENILSNI